MMEHTDLTAVELTKFQKVVRMAMSAVIPQKDDEDKLLKNYMERYNCCPPPLFIVIISAIEVCTRLSVCLSVCLLVSVCLIIFRDHSFLWNSEFLAEPRNLRVST